jgi:hypothetical protein
VGTVFTARLAYDGADRLNITRQGGHASGALFAPSWALLRARLELRRAGRARPETWPAYAAAYAREMAALRAARPDAWAALRARPLVTLCCACENAACCHRVLLARLLATDGAVYEGERGARAMNRETRRNQKFRPNKGSCPSARRDTRADWQPATSVAAPPVAPAEAALRERMQPAMELIARAVAPFQHSQLAWIFDAGGDLHVFVLFPTGAGLNVERAHRWAGAGAAATDDAVAAPFLRAVAEAVGRPCAATVYCGAEAHLSVRDGDGGAATYHFDERGWHSPRLVPAELATPPAAPSSPAATPPGPA